MRRFVFEKRRWGSRGVFLCLFSALFPAAFVSPRVRYLVAFVSCRGGFLQRGVSRREGFLAETAEGQRVYVVCVCI